jgi:hypothetical protein
MKHYFFFLLLLVTFFSCTKEASDEFITDPGNPYNDTAWVQTIPAVAPVNEVFQIFSKPSETNSFEAAIGDTLNLSNGLEVIFPPNACGPAVTGTLQLSVDQLRTKGDLVRFGRSTLSNDELLVSGGAFNIHVSQRASHPVLADDKYISIKYPAANPASSMNIFYGDTNINSREDFNWVKANDNSYASWGVSGTDSFYKLTCRKFDWINCDKFLNSGSDLTKVSVILPANFTNKNTAVFLISTDELLVARCKADPANRLFYLSNIPVGKQFEILTLSKIGYDLFLGTENINITTNIVVHVSPEKKSQEDISTYLDSL